MTHYTTPDQTRRGPHGLAVLRERVAQSMRRHLVPLGIVVIISIVSQMIVWLQTPRIGIYPDSLEYLAEANHLLSGDVTPHVTRTPGYPAFLAIVFAVTGGQHLSAVVLAQSGLIALAALEIYILAFRLCGNRLESAILAALLGANLFIANWSRAILSEALTYWLIVTIMLCFERYLRRERLLSLSALTLLCVIVIFTRPQALYLPVILLGVLLYRAARQGRFSARWRPLALSFVLIYGLVLGYIAAFALTYGAFTMSKVSNADLLGTAMALHSRYHMPLDGADARFDQLRGDLLSLHSSEADPWGFIKAHPEYDSNAGALYGEFASQVLRAHPGYVVRGAYDTFLTTTSWNQAPAALGPLGGLPFWLAPLLQLSTVISLAYACLPLLFLATGMAAWRHPDDATTLALFALMSVVVVHIAVAVLADFESFNRLRFPVDWAMLLVSGLVVTGLLTGRISLRLQRSP